jgi:hypothetical protein
VISIETIYSIDDTMINEYGAAGVMRSDGRGERKYLKKISPSATFSTTNPP